MTYFVGIKIIFDLVLYISLRYDCFIHRLLFTQYKTNKIIQFMQKIMATIMYTKKIMATMVYK